MKKLVIAFFMFFLIELSYVPVALLLGCELSDMIFCKYGWIWFIYIFNELILVILGLVIFIKLLIKLSRNKRSKLMS